MPARGARLDHYSGRELGTRKITVNAVGPGLVETELFLNGKAEADVARMASMAPQNRIGQPSEIAEVVCLPGLPGSGLGSGQIVRANGGIAYPAAQ